MSQITNLFVLLGLLLTFILGILLLVSRRRKAALQPQPRAPVSPRQRLVRALKLTGFGLLAFVLILGVLVIYQNYQTVMAETSPVQRPVDLPAGLPFTVEEVTFPGSGGVDLAGWYVPSSNGATIILLHGYGGTRASMLWYAETLVGAGYGVLLYDERASGESTGDRRSYGWEDAPDVGAAVQFIKDRTAEPQPRTGICGCSTGAQIALQGAALYPDIQAVWADGPSNIRAADNPPPQNPITGLVVASNYLLDWMYERRLDIPAPPPMIERIGEIAPRPVMLVGGGTEVGLFGSEAPRVERYASFAGPNARVWIIEEAIHCNGPEKQPAEYAQRLVEFFDAALAVEK